MKNPALDHRYRPCLRPLGFTLLELLIVIAVIGLLSTLAAVTLNNARGKARDTARKAALQQVAKALELYYADHNAYPTTGGSWWGPSTTYGSHCYVDGCGGSGPYIPGLAPKYMAALPADPYPHGIAGACAYNYGYAGYLYNSNGVNYKFLSHCTADGGYVPTDQFADPSRPTWAWAVSSPGGTAW